MVLPALLLASVSCSRWSLASLRFYAAREAAWELDLPSALVGFTIGVLLALAIYLLRHRITAFREGVISQVRRMRHGVSKGVGDRYCAQILRTAEQAHLLKRYAPLSKLYVAHRLVVPHRSPLSERFREKGEKDDLWRLVSLHDLWYRSRDTTDVGNALRQSSRLAILGPMGSGRTTLLADLAQRFAQGKGWQLTLDEPQETDPLEVRTAREKERERLPVWLALDAIDPSLAQGRGRHVLIEPIVDALVATLSGLVARPASSLVRSKTISGECIFLLDGLDALDLRVAKYVLEWLDSLSRAYPENIFVVTGALESYSALRNIGFVPLVLDGFRQQQVARFVDRWESLREEAEVADWRDQVQAAREAFEQEVERARREGLPLPEEADFVPSGLPGRAQGLLAAWKGGQKERVLPLDLALAALLWREQGQVPRSALMRHAQTVVLALDRITDNPLEPPQWARVLGCVAWTMRNEGRHTVHRAEIEEHVAEILAAAKAATIAEQSEIPAMGEGQPLLEEPLSEPAESPEKEEDFGKPARAALSGLLEVGDLVIDAGRARVAFVHPTFGAYFAAQHAARNGEGERIRAHIRDPDWHDTVRFYAALAEARALVLERLKGADDVFRNNFFVAADYVAASPEDDVQLRKSILAELAQLFLGPTQPTMLRRRAAGIIADVRDDGALYLFGQALRHEDPHVRRLGVWGVALLDDERLLDGLVYALSDEDVLVRADALHALGALGGDQVIDGLVQGLADQHELPRRVAAEVLAALGGEGWDLLQEASQSRDMYIRRAAVHGLGRVDEAWAFEIIDEISREDSEWYVRSAASEILERIKAGSAPILPQFVRLEDEAWLGSWAMAAGIEVGNGTGAFRALLRACQDGSWSIKVAAADALRVCGDTEAIEPLRTMLTDADMLVRETAFVALAEINQRTGAHIPVARPREDGGAV